MVTIALDAMGGDHFPKPEVEGAVQAAKALGVKVILVGKEDVVRHELNRHPGLEVDRPGRVARRTARAPVTNRPG